MSDRFSPRPAAALLLSLALALGALAGCEYAPVQAAGSPAGSSAASQDKSLPASRDDSQPTPSQAESPAPLQPAHTAGQEKALSLPAPNEAALSDGLPSVPAYDFSQPAPEGEAVDVSYFDDAAFVGDSRTEGFLIYSGIGRGKNLTSNGLSIFKLDTKKALTIDGTAYTLLEALALEQYGKVYLSLGVNELGTYNDDGFYQSYCEAIDYIRSVQPNAVIYIQGLIPLNEDVIAQTTGRTYLTNEHLRVYNSLMQKAAQEKQVVYLDLYSEFVDDSGQLPADASKDGVHLRSAWCKQWLAYLETHTVDYDTLYPDGAPRPAPAQGESAEGSGKS